MGEPIVIALDGTSASGKSTNAKLVAKALGYVYVDTGAMYRSLAWHCLEKGVALDNEKAVASLCRRWKAELRNDDGHIRLYVDGYFPEKEIRTAETSAAVPIVAAVPGVRKWMKIKQRDCARFGNLVMEGRDIGSNIFPETDFKYYLNASLAERDKRDSQRAAAPLMIALGARVIDNSAMTAEETSTLIINEMRERLEADG